LATALFRLGFGAWAYCEFDVSREEESEYEGEGEGEGEGKIKRVASLPELRS
jgi:hypothetical protein